MGQGNFVWRWVEGGEGGRGAGKRGGLEIYGIETISIACMILVLDCGWGWR